MPLIDFSQIKESSPNTIRKRLDGQQFIIKYNAEPTFISDKTVVPVLLMNYPEALSLMQTDKWDAKIEE